MEDAGGTLEQAGPAAIVDREIGCDDVAAAAVVVRQAQQLDAGQAGEPLDGLAAEIAGRAGHDDGAKLRHGTLLTRPGAACRAALPERGVPS